MHGLSNGSHINRRVLTGELVEMYMPGTSPHNAFDSVVLESKFIYKFQVISPHFVKADLGAKRLHGDNCNVIILSLHKRRHDECGEVRETWKY